MDDVKREYRIGGIVSPSEVPNWARREPKWKELIAMVLDLEPGQTLTVMFDDQDTANRARNTVRDTINLAENKASVRTRVAFNPETQESVTYFTRLHDKDIRTEKRIPPQSTKK